MGLDLRAGSSHEQFSYMGFSQMRETLARLANLGADYDVSDYYDKGLWGFWKPEDKVPDDIIFLLSHYDHDGYLMPWTSGKIAKRIKELTRNVVPAPGETFVYAEIEDLRKFLKTANKKWKVVTFS